MEEHETNEELSEERPQPAALLKECAAAADGADPATLAFVTARALEDRRSRRRGKKEKEKAKKTLLRFLPGHASSLVDKVEGPFR